MSDHAAIQQAIDSLNTAAQHLQALQLAPQQFPVKLEKIVTILVYGEHEMTLTTSELIQLTAGPNALQAKHATKFFGPDLTLDEAAELVDWAAHRLNYWGVVGFDQLLQKMPRTICEDKFKIIIVLHFVYKGKLGAYPLNTLIHCKLTRQYSALPEFVLQHAFGVVLTGRFNYDNFWASVRNQLSCFG